MKVLLAAILAIFCHQAYAGCEATIIEGSHSAASRAEAESGAWEDVKDICFPGKAEKMNAHCEQARSLTDKKSHQIVRCVQEASCTVCDDNLIRKYEALE